MPQDISSPEQSQAKPSVHGLSPSLQVALEHVALIAGSPDAEICIRLIHDSDRHAPAISLTGSLAHHWPEIVEYQRKGYGAFFVINAGGHNDGDITGVRALFVDGDNISVPETWHAEPDFLVKRDATHWHAYWLVSDLPVNEFRAAQKRLVARYGSDPRVCNPSRVMRLAGTLHQKKEDAKCA